MPDGGSKGRRHPLARPETVLKPVSLNLGIQARYRRKVSDLLQKMQRDLDRQLKKAYPNAADLMSMDELQRVEHRHALMAMDAPDPMVLLQRYMRRWGHRWSRRFDQMAEAIAQAFATQNMRNFDAMFRRRLRQAGFTVRFQTTERMRAAWRAISQENVNLIRSIPQQYLTQVNGIINRGVMRGGALGQISRELRQRYNVAQSRAALIARDQNAKARAVFEGVRQVELGIEEAIWRHSHAGIEPRPTHVAMDGQRYRIRQGMWDPDPQVRRYIHPGELINCRCTTRAVLPNMPGGRPAEVTPPSSREVSRMVGPAIIKSRLRGGR